MPGQPATNYGPRAPNPAPTMQVHDIAFGDVGIYGVEDGCGRFRRVWNTHVPDRETMIGLIRVQPLGIGQEFSILGQVDKSVDPCFSERRQFGPGSLLVVFDHRILPARNWPGSTQ